jgi:hypothetical protein
VGASRVMPRRGRRWFLPQCCPPVVGPRRDVGWAVQRLERQNRISEKVAFHHSQKNCLECDNDRVRIRGRSTGAKPILPNTIGAKAAFRWASTAYCRPKDYFNKCCLLDCGRVVVVPRVARGDRVLHAIRLCLSASLLVSGRH